MKPKSKKKVLIKIEKLNQRTNILPLPPPQPTPQHPPQHSTSLPQSITNLKPTFKQSHSNSEQIRENYKKEIIDACQYQVRQLKKKNRKKILPVTREEINRYAELIERQIFIVKSCGEDTDSIEYRTQIKALIYNMKDPQNSELRQKILYKKISPQQIAECDEIYFLSPKKRELQIHNNWNRFIAYDKQESGKQEQEVLDVETDWDEEVSEQVEPPNYNLDVLKDIEELLSDAPVRKIKQRLEEVTQRKIKQKLVKNLSKVFY